MKTLTIDLLRLRFLKIISAVNLAVSILLIVYFGIIGKDLPIIHYFLLIISAITLGVIKKFPTNTIIVKVNPILISMFYAYSNYLDIAVNGELMVYQYFLFPLFASFLLGSIGGFTLSFIHLMLPLVIFSFDISIFGDTARAFISVYLIEIVTILFFERIHDYLLKHIRKAASTDSLTGLLNTSGFMYTLTKETSKKNSFYLILTDFDYFSRINTNLGYTICDDILKHGGKILRNDKNVLYIARYYGDQFSIIIKGDEEYVKNYLIAKQAEIRNISNKLNIDIDITISSGIIHYPGDCDSVENLMANVELALKEAKKSDRETYCFFNALSLKEQQNWQTINATLRTALQNDEIEVHFQPKVSTEHSRVTGMESLLRWNHPQLGYLTPPEYISVAEKTGLISDVGEFVITKSLEHLSRCMSEGVENISISINISPIHLLAKNFLSKLLDETVKFKVEPQQVYLEITENLMLQSDVSAHLKKIQDAGFKLSLDDFGTGYSSLNYLRQFSFDELKIDKCFTDGLLSGDSDKEMFETILSIAKIFKMSTVIEGVEEYKQIEMLKHLNVSEIQGWYFSKALPSDQFIAYAKNFDLKEPSAT